MTEVGIDEARVAVAGEGKCEVCRHRCFALAGKRGSNQNGLRLRTAR